MNSLPDLSYFAVPGFIADMRQRPSLTSSIILYSGRNSNWDAALSEENAYLYTWLHNRTGDEHDVYLPHTVTPHFLTYNESYIQSLIRPAQNRIKSYLEALGVDDIDSYMANSDEWLSVLFASKQEHYSASEMVATYFDIDIARLPLIIVWTDLDSHSVILILPNQDDDDLQEYIKSIYWSLTTASRSLNRKNQLAINKLQDEFLKTCDTSHHIKDYSHKVREIFTIRLDEPVSVKLRQLGSHYAKSFDCAILNFQEAFEKASSVNSITRYVSDTYSNIIKRLQQSGFQKLREGNNHVIWKHPNLNKPTPVPRHQKITPFVVNSIEKDICQALQV